jgi:hypothetical protein
LKKHKADEDTRFQGTLLGTSLDPQPVMVAGAQGGLNEWMDRYKSRAEAVEEGTSPAESSLPSTAPDTPSMEDEQEQSEEGVSHFAPTTSTPITAT